MLEPSGAFQGHFVGSRFISSRITSGPGDKVDFITVTTSLASRIAHAYIENAPNALFKHVLQKMRCTIVQSIT